MKVLLFISTLMLATSCLSNNVQVDKEALQKAKLEQKQDEKLYIKLKSGQ